MKKVFENKWFNLGVVVLDCFLTLGAPVLGVSAMFAYVICFLIVINKNNGNV